MSKDDFIFVGSPHTPITISGSDPYHPSTMSGSARLACWYKLEPGMFTTGSSNTSAGRKIIERIYDFSGNDQSRNTRYLSRQDDFYPILESKKGASRDTLVIKNDPSDEAQGSMIMRNTAINADVTSANWATWISGSTSDDVAKDATSIFAAMQYITDGTYVTRPFTVSYGTDDRDDVAHGLGHTFSLGLWHDNTPGNRATPVDGKLIDRGVLYGFDRLNSNAQTNTYGSYNQSLSGGFHALSLTYTGTNSYILQTYANGRLQLRGDFSNSGNDRPGHHGTNKSVMIGGNGYGEGGGYADGTSTTSSVGEMFAFDDALSNIRRQQMERYLCDKYEIPMSSSE